MLIWSFSSIQNNIILKETLWINQKKNCFSSIQNNIILKGVFVQKLCSFRELYDIAIKNNSGMY